MLDFIGLFVDRFDLSSILLTNTGRVADECFCLNYLCIRSIFNDSGYCFDLFYFYDENELFNHTLINDTQTN